MMPPNSDWSPQLPMWIKEMRLCPPLINQTEMRYLHTDTTGIPQWHIVPSLVQKKEGDMVWHGTQCFALPGMGEMAALQWHHRQSYSPFSMTCSMPTFGKTCQHWQTGQACNNTLVTIHTWLSLKGNRWVHELTLTTVDETHYHTHIHTIHQ